MPTSPFSAWEEAELQKRRRRDEKHDAILHEQGLAAERVAKEKAEEWRRVAGSS